MGHDVYFRTAYDRWKTTSPDWYDNDPDYDLEDIREVPEKYILINWELVDQDTRKGVIIPGIRVTW